MHPETLRTYLDLLDSGQLEPYERAELLRDNPEVAKAWRELNHLPNCAYSPPAHRAQLGAER
jgi:hypothetical protein